MLVVNSLSPITVACPFFAPGYWNAHFSFSFGTSAAASPGFG